MRKTTFIATIAACLAEQEKKEEAARASQMADTNAHWRQSRNAISNSV